MPRVVLIFYTPCLAVAELKAREKNHVVSHCNETSIAITIMLAEKRISTVLT